LDYKSGIIDLHIHSTASDGSIAPLDILLRAKKARLSAFALTDHDAITGTREILAHRHLLGPVKFLSGVEISAQPPDFFNAAGSFHVLGYGFDVEDPDLNQALQAQRQARKNRNPQILARLNDLGFDITLDTVIIESEKNAQIGRPHIARVMVKKGFAASIDDAFDTWLGKGKPAYVEKARIGTPRAMELIRKAGGIPVLAHPGLLEVVDFNAYEHLIAELVPMGLKGLEVYYPGHAPEETDYFLELTEKFGLLPTGGSDFHGAINPEVEIGTGTGNLAVPYVVYERLAREISRLKVYSPAGES
jgi:predicted metal-dependent phosphoesterase TrpH